MPTRLPGLDLLRAIAVLWTMQFHSFIVGGLGEDWRWLERYGWMGVDLFFVLSGFLIGGQLLRPLARGESPSLRDFYLKRAFRILPAFWVVLALYGVFVIGMVDNVLRPILVGKDTKMPDFLILISTLGGMAIFGLNGFVIGPLIAALFLSSWGLFSGTRRKVRLPADIPSAD